MALILGAGQNLNQGGTKKQTIDELKNLIMLAEESEEEEKGEGDQAERRGRKREMQIDSTVGAEIV